MTATQWLVGWASLLAAGTALVAAAVGLRRRLMPQCDGPAAILATAILWNALLIGLGQALGTIGLFRTETVVLAAFALGLAFRPRLAPAGASPDRQAARAGPRLAPTDRWGWLTGAALTVGLGVLAVTWLSSLLAVLRLGSSDGDSMMYHLPFATRFVQTGSTAEVTNIGPTPWVAFYPANVELVQAFFMLPFKHVALVPLLSFGWLALALLAAWCIGHPRGQGPLALLLTATLLTLPITAATHAGTARVDVATAAFLLSAVALLLVEPRNPGSCFVAGLAVGLAAGSKFVVLPTLAVLVVTAGLVLWTRRERTAAGLLALGTVLPVAFWALRNWLVTGNPLPMLDLKVGPVGFEALDDDRMDSLDNSSVMHYLSNGAGDVIRRGLEDAFGHGLLAVILLATGAVGLGLVLRQRPVGLAHAVAATGLVACVLYIFTPYTAPIEGFETEPIASLIVALNARYLVPGLLVLLCALPLGLAARWRRTSALACLATAATVAYLATEHGNWEEWPVDGGDLLGAAALAVVLGAAVGVPTIWWRRSDRPDRGRRSAWLATGLSGFTALAVIAGGTWSVASAERLNRYGASHQGHADLWYRVHAEPPGQHVALVGEWLRQPYVRDDLRNTVDYVGLSQGGGLWDPPETCDGLRGELSGGEYDLVVIQRGALLGDPMNDEIDWVTSIADSEVLLRNDGGVIVRLPQTIDPTCPV